MEEVGIEYPSIIIKKEHLTSKLFNYFVLCSIYSNNFSNPSSNISSELTDQSEQQALNNKHTILSEKPMVGDIPKKQKLTKIKPTCHIKCNIDNNSEWKSTVVFCRAGKATRIYSKCWNVETSNGQQIFIDLS